MPDSGRTEMFPAQGPGVPPARSQLPVTNLVFRAIVADVPLLARLANMADPVNMHEAKTELSRLVERALRGEEIIISRAGVPVVRLVPVMSRGKRTVGQWAGKVRMSDDFDAPLSPEDLDAWEGR